MFSFSNSVGFIKKCSFHVVKFTLHMLAFADPSVPDGVIHPASEAMNTVEYTGAILSDILNLFSAFYHSYLPNVSYIHHHHHDIILHEPNHILISQGEVVAINNHVNPMRLAYQKFSVLNSSAPEELECDITRELMREPCYHPGEHEKNYKYERSSILKMLDMQNNLRHPHTREIVTYQEFKTANPIKDKISIYLRLVQEYYSWLEAMAAELREQVLTKTLPTMINQRSYSTSLLFREHRLAQSYQRNALVDANELKSSPLKRVTS